MIAEYDRDYLWILSRTPKLDQKTLQTLIDQAQSLGFATQNLIYP
ncbi:lipocalin family protein [Methylobacter sp. Wu1]